MRFDSKIGDVLERISIEITNSKTFEDTPIFYDFIEVDANNLPPSCIVYKPLEWGLDNTGCVYERQLDIVLLITTEERREGIVAQLFMFAEQLKELIDTIDINGLQFRQGSPVRGFAYNRKSNDSYKEQSTVFTSMIILSYLLRY